VPCIQNFNANAEAYLAPLQHSDAAIQPSSKGQGSCRHLEGGGQRVSTHWFVISLLPPTHYSCRRLGKRTITMVLYIETEFTRNSNTLI
jgi:hypothetical protein